MNNLENLLKIKENGEGVSAFAEIPSNEDLSNYLVDEIISDIQANVNEDVAVECRYGLTEAMSNALYHGNLGLKNIRDTKEREERLANADLNKKNISLSYFRTAGYLVFTVTDEGEGFNHERDFKGLGAKMIKATMDEVCFNTKGNSITMLKYF